MTFHQLEIFDAVAEQLSVTEAARKIKISQPSVSKQLRFLERECGLKLYVKSGRGIKITDEGRLLQIAAKPILKQMEELREYFSEPRHSCARQHAPGGEHAQPGGVLFAGRAQVLRQSSSECSSDSAHCLP